MDNYEPRVVAVRCIAVRSVERARQHVKVEGNPSRAILSAGEKFVIEATNHVAQTADGKASDEIQAVSLAADQGLTDLSEFTVCITPAHVPYVWVPRTSPRSVLCRSVQ